MRHRRGGRTHWHWAAKFGIDLVRHCARELYRDNALEMAASLAYRTLFSIIPILVLGLLFFRAFIGLDQIEQQVQGTVLDFLGLNAIPYEYHAGPEIPSEQPEHARSSAEQESNVRETVADRVGQLTKRVAELNFTSVGTIGLGVLVYAALALVISMEENFNLIYGAVAGRSYTRKLFVYWTVLTLGPLLLMISFLTVGQVASRAESLPVVGSVIGGLSHGAAFAASWALLFSLYTLLPYTKVHVRPALIASLVCAALWSLAKWVFSLYVNRFVPYSVLYGTLGLIPLFMFWVYLTWLIVLFGLELTYTLQVMHGRRFNEEEASKKHEDLIVDPAWIIPLAAAIASSFRRGRTSDIDSLCHTLNLPQPAVTRLLTALHEAELVHSVSERGADGYSLARPAEFITVRELLDAVSMLFSTQSDESRLRAAWQVVERFRGAGYALVADTTLADLSERRET